MCSLSAMTPFFSGLCQGAYIDEQLPWQSKRSRTRRTKQDYGTHAQVILKCVHIHVY